jgi:hypothetical protein
MSFARTISFFFSAIASLTPNEVSTSFSRQRHLFNADALRFPPEVGAAQDVEDVFETLVLLFTRPTSGASTMCSW